MTTWGSTEAGDPAFDRSWTSKLQDINLVITKSLTDDLIAKLIVHSEKCVLHLTVTGLAKSFMEPCVPSVQENAKQLKKLLEKGFPVEQAVLRIDPMLNASLGCGVLDEFKDTGVKRVRFSFLNLTNHTDNDISKERLGFYIEEARELVTYSEKMKYGYTFESCAGAWLSIIPNVKLIGCMSFEEAKRVLKKDIRFIANDRARSACMAPGNRVELLEGKTCGHKCKYCFWGGDCGRAKS